VRSLSVTRRAVPGAALCQRTPILAAADGMRVRLKAVNISAFPADVQVILTGLKTYGMLLADNGGTSST
jgi:hypothetical protein